MSTVDAILASGRYTDSRGREWHFCDLFPACAPCDRWHTSHPSTGIAENEMRLLIERDQHRDECFGLRRCLTHPVPHVLSAEWDRSRFEGLMVYPAGNSLPIDKEFETLPEAIDAARALAVGE